MSNPFQQEANDLAENWGNDPVQGLRNFMRDQNQKGRVDAMGSAISALFHVWSRRPGREVKIAAESVEMVAAEFGLPILECLRSSGHCNCAQAFCDFLGIQPGRFSGPASALTPGGEWRLTLNKAE